MELSVGKIPENLDVPLYDSLALASWILVYSNGEKTREFRSKQNFPGEALEENSLIDLLSERWSQKNRQVLIHFEPEGWSFYGSTLLIGQYRRESHFADIETLF